MKAGLKPALLLIHYWFPVALGWSIATVIHQATGLPITSSGIHLYLLTIMAAYSLDRWLDRSDEVRTSWLTAVLFAGFLISAILGAFIAVQLSVKTISLMVVFSIITILYCKVKKIPFLKAVLVSIVWVWAGVAFSFQNQNWFAWQFWTMPPALPLVLLIAAGVILCDFKDVKLDDRNGIQSLPVMFGSRNTILFTTILLIIAAGISYEQGRMGLVYSSAALIGLSQFPFILSLDAIGPLLVDAALTLPGLLIFLHLV